MGYRYLREFSAVEADQLVNSLTGPDAAEKAGVKSALTNGWPIHGYIPETSLQVILSHAETLAAAGILEENLVESYRFTSNFESHSRERLKEVFGFCCRERLLECYPVPRLYPHEDEFRFGGRYTLFRGCAGENHLPGLSWTWSLDKAIWYAAWHCGCNSLSNPRVYCATVTEEEITCCIRENEYEFILEPAVMWPIEIPVIEFRLDRPR